MLRAPSRMRRDHWMTAWRAGAGRCESHHFQELVPHGQARAGEIHHDGGRLRRVSRRPFRPTGNFRVGLIGPLFSDVQVRGPSMQCREKDGWGRVGGSFRLRAESVTADQSRDVGITVSVGPVRLPLDSRRVQTCSGGTVRGHQSWLGECRLKRLD